MYSLIKFKADGLFQLIKKKLVEVDWTDFYDSPDVDVAWGLMLNHNTMILDLAPRGVLSNLNDNRAIFQIPSKSKSINSCANWLKNVLIYRQSINERHKSVSVMFCGI